MNNLRTYYLDKGGGTLTSTSATAVGKQATVVQITDIKSASTKENKFALELSGFSH